MFQHVEPYAGDPILSLNDTFQKDPRPHRINLSIGIYFDDEGRIPVLESVRRAEAQVAAIGGPKPYLPMEGAANCRAAVQRLIFGAGHAALAAGRVATIQSVGSSASLRVGADFLHRHLPASGVWVSDPTWDNHRAMFEGAGLAVRTYPTTTRPRAACASTPCARCSTACPSAASCCCTPAATTRPASI